MPIDRGGLQYAIEVENRFSQGLDQFKADVRAARAEYAKLKKELASGRTASRAFAQNTRDIRSLTKARKSDISAIQQQGAAEERLGRRFDARRNALAGLRQETQRQATSQARALITSRQSYTIERRLAIAEQARSRAEKDITKTVDKRRVVEERANAAKSRGVKLTDKERSSLGLISEAEKRAAKSAKLLSDAKERGALATQRQVAADNQARIASLRTNILARAAENEKLAKAKKAVALATEKQAAAEEKLRARQQVAAQRERLRQTEQTRKAVKALHQQQNIANNTNLRQTHAQTEALRRKNAVLKEQATRRILATQGLDARGAPIQAERRTIKERLRNFLKLNKTLHKTKTEGNSVSFTFRRLFGILAAFAAARIGVSAFGSMVKQMILFNSNLKNAEIGVASLLTAVGNVRDATGEATVSSHQLALAQNESRKQLALLRRDALATVATFDQLVTAFQVAVAPGLQSGLDLDEIRTFSVQIAQAAAAIGLEQNQLAEEIRSILEGTIRSRTTRIATSLGITNEDIRQAKEAGVLFEFLQERFLSFSVAGAEVAKNFEALFVNLKDGFTQVIGAGGIEFFETLKKLLSDLRGQIISEDPITGFLRPDPRAVSIIAAIATGLAAATAEASRLQDALGFEDVHNIASVIGGSIRIGAQLLSAAIEGVVLGFADLKEIISFVVDAIEEITGIDLAFDVDSIQSAVRLAVRFLTIVTTINLIVGSMSLVFAPFVALWSTLTIVLGGVLTLYGLISTVVGAISVKSLILVAPYIAIVAVLGAGLELLRRWASEIAGVDLKFSSLVKFLKQTLTNIFANIIVNITFAFNKLFTIAKITFIKIQAFVIDTSFAILDAILAAAALVSNAAAAERRKLKKFRSEEATAQDAAIKAEEDKLALLIEQDRAAKAALQNMNDEALLKILEDNDTAPTILEGISSLAKQASGAIAGTVKDAFSGVKNELEGFLDPSIQDATKLSETFEKLPGIIAASRRGLADQEKLIKELRDSAEEANDALRFGETTLGLDGGVLEQRRVVFEAEVTQRKKSEQLTISERNVRLKLIDIDRQRLRIERQFAAVSERDQGIVEQGISAGKRILDVKREIASAEVRVSLERAKIQKDIQDGIAEEERSSEVILQIEEDHLNKLIERLETEKQIADQILEGRDQEEATRLSKIITEQLRLAGELKVNQEQLNALAEDRAGLEHEINLATIARLKLISDQSTFDLTQGIKEAKRELSELAIEFNTRFDTQSNRELAFAQNKLQTLRDESNEALRLQKIEIDNLQLIIDQTKAQDALLRKRAENTESEEEKTKLLRDAQRYSELITSQERLLLTIKQRNAVAQQEQNILLARATEETQLAIDKVERPIFTGFTEGMRQSLLGVGDAFQNTLDLVRNAVRGFADFTSSAIVDAFDPSAKVDIEERFGRLLQAIARQILSTLVQIAVTKAALGLANVPIGFSRGGQVPSAPSGFASGGQIPDKTPWHSARGFAAGGRQARDARPRGLPPTDTVPIWTTPGEWVIRTAAVRKYGADIMGQINQGLIDPLSLRALAGARRLSSRTAQVPRAALGFASGGQVPSTPREPQGTPSRDDSNNVSIAIVAPSENSMERLLSGGKGAMLQFIEQHADTIRPLLSTG